VVVYADVPRASEERLLGIGEFGLLVLLHVRLRVMHHRLRRPS
jgi:hypothetical protein